MPSRKTKSGEFKDVAHPISSDFRAVMQEAILIAYENADEPVESKNGKNRLKILRKSPNQLKCTGQIEQKPVF